ncbi:hypothetical protein T439DRAFT_9503 [Meredithblackwellia eburnea MCA 4105]
MKNHWNILETPIVLRCSDSSSFSACVVVPSPGCRLLLLLLCRFCAVGFHFCSIFVVIRCVLIFYFSIASGDFCRC